MMLTEVIVKANGYPRTLRILKPRRTSHRLTEEHSESSHMQAAGVVVGAAEEAVRTMRRLEAAVEVPASQPLTARGMAEHNDIILDLRKELAAAAGNLSGQELQEIATSRPHILVPVL